MVCDEIGPDLEVESLGLIQAEVVRIHVHGVHGDVVRWLHRVPNEGVVVVGLLIRIRVHFNVFGEG